MQTETKDFLKEAFWSKKRSQVERRTSWWDWSKEKPFVLIRQEFNDYVWDEAIIIKFLYGDYDKGQQRLCKYDGKNVDEIDITYMENDRLKKRTVCFDLTEVF